MAQESPEAPRGPFEVRTTSGSSSTVRKHHTLGGANTYTNPPGEEGPLLEPPIRRYECQHYEGCLDLAATLNWASFTCRNCVGTPNEALQWRAHQIRKRDSVAQALCDLPRITTIEKRPAENADTRASLKAAVVGSSDDDL